MVTFKNFQIAQGVLNPDGSPKSQPTTPGMPPRTPVPIPQEQDAPMQQADYPEDPYAGVEDYANRAIGPEQKATINPTKDINIGPIHLKGHTLDTLRPYLAQIYKQFASQPLGDQPHQRALGIAAKIGVGGYLGAQQERIDANAESVKKADDFNKERRTAGAALARIRLAQRVQAQPKTLKQIEDEHAAMARGNNTGNPPEEVQHLSDEELGTLATTVVRGGPIPTFGMGQSSDRTRFYSALARQLKTGDQDLGANRAILSGLRTSYSNMRKLYDNTTAFENTALKNSTVLEQSLSQLLETGSPWMNRPLRLWDRSVMGKNGTVAFETARRIVGPEFARLLTSATASGVLSDDSRKEVMSVLGPDPTGAQIREALRILRLDAANRKSSYQGQLRDIEEAIRGIGKPTQDAPPPPPDTADSIDAKLSRILK